jgi:hypothetical protein
VIVASSKKLKLSDGMKEVLLFVANGWELGYTPHTGRAWMQAGGLGGGGAVQRVNRSTFNGLVSRGFLKMGMRREHSMTDPYVLTSTGEGVARELDKEEG